MEEVVGDDGGVEIPVNDIQLSEAQYSELQSRIDPLMESDDFGVEPGIAYVCQQPGQLLSV